MCCDVKQTNKIKNFSLALWIKLQDLVNEFICSNLSTISNLKMINFKKSGVLVRILCTIHDRK